jgi:hypothetical protein
LSRMKEGRMRRVCGLGLALAILSAPCLVEGHEGHKHTAMGTVERVEKARLDVKDADGKALSFALTAKTVVFRGETASTTASLKSGERVAVEFEEAGGVKTALKVHLEDSQKAMRYSCSMHPEVVSDKPGKCPKCGMNLTPAEASKP